ncbi:MAG: ABC transporter permease [Phycisphaerales bacterium]
MSEPLPAQPDPLPSARPARPGKPAWLRVASAQEFGLLVVIAVMVVGLTLATPWIARPERVGVPEGATVDQTATAVVVSEPGHASVSYPIAEGWGLTQRGTMQFVEQKERRSLSNGTVVEDLPDARGWTATGVGVAAEFLAADGWQLAEGPDGVPSFERDPRVNRFFNKDNLIAVGTYASFIAIMAVGMTGIIVMGGIDLSVGAIYALSAVVGATALQAVGQALPGISPWAVVPLGVVVCGGVGALCGAVNGGASVGLGVHPFIITLGGMAVYRGIAFVLSKGLSIGEFPPAYAGVIRSSLLGINPVPTLIMVLVGLAGAFVATRTVFGRQTFAIGGNETAARYAGIPVGRVKVQLFVIVGALAGLSAAIMLGYLGAGSSDAGNGYELNVIAAAVVGGASLSGGRGSAVGAVLGAIVIQLINNGFDVLGIDSNYRQIVIGLAIVLAVVVDQAKYRFFAAKR